MKNSHIVIIILFLFTLSNLLHCARDLRYENKHLVRDKCMYCHDLAYGKPYATLRSMCVNGDADQTLEKLEILFSPERISEKHKEIVLSPAELRRIAAYICNPYDPPTSLK